MKMTKSVLSQQVEAFHRAMGQPVVDEPAIPEDARVRLRLRLIAEEFCELLEASIDMGDEAFAELRADLQYIIDLCPVAVDLPSVVDALADLDYVVEGTRLELGVNGSVIASVVHEANMAKVGGTMRPDGKIEKPADWTPPDIVGALRVQGWPGAAPE